MTRITDGHRQQAGDAVQFRFDVRCSPWLPEEVRARLEKLAGPRLAQEGVLIITAQRYRSQERNRQDALERLVDLIQRAAQPATKPSAGTRRRRLYAKKQRFAIKRLRRMPCLTRWTGTWSAFKNRQPGNPGLELG